MVSYALALVLAGPALPGSFVYEARTETSASLGGTETRQETVRVVGSRSRSLDTGGETTVCDRSLEAKRCRRWDDKTRAWWFGGDPFMFSGASVPGSGGAPSIDRIEVSIRDEGEAPAVDGIPVRRASLLVAFATRRVIGGFPVTSKIDTVGEFLVANGKAVEPLVPHERFELAFGIPEVDARVRREIGEEPRVALRTDVRQTERFDSGGTRTWSVKRVISSLRSGPAVANGFFETPKGYRFEKPSAPGRTP